MPTIYRSMCSIYSCLCSYAHNLLFETTKYEIQNTIIVERTVLDKGRQAQVERIMITDHECICVSFFSFIFIGFICANFSLRSRTEMTLDRPHSKISVQPDTCLVTCVNKFRESYACNHNVSFSACQLIYCTYPQKLICTVECVYSSVYICACMRKNIYT